MGFFLWLACQCGILCQPVCSIQLSAGTLQATFYVHPGFFSSPDADTIHLVAADVFFSIQH